MNNNLEIQKKEALLKSTKMANNLNMSMVSAEQNMGQQSLRINQTIDIYKDINNKTDKSHQLIGMLKKGSVGCLYFIIY